MHESVETLAQLAQPHLAAQRRIPRSTASGPGVGRAPGARPRLRGQRGAATALQAAGVLRVSVAPRRFGPCATVLTFRAGVETVSVEPRPAPKCAAPTGIGAPSAAHGTGAPVAALAAARARRLTAPTSRSRRSRGDRIRAHRMLQIKVPEPHPSRTLGLIISGEVSQMLHEVWSDQGQSHRYITGYDVQDIAAFMVSPDPGSRIESLTQIVV